MRMTKLRNNVVYVFSIFHDDVITPNLGNYLTDMTISSKGKIICN